MTLLRATAYALGVLYDAMDRPPDGSEAPYPDRRFDNKYCWHCREITNHRTSDHEAAEAEGPSER